MLVTPPTLPPDPDPDASRSDATPSFAQLGNPSRSAPTTLHIDVMATRHGHWLTVVCISSLLLYICKSLVMRQYLLLQIRNPWLEPHHERVGMGERAVHDCHRVDWMRRVLRYLERPQSQCRVNEH